MIGLIGSALSITVPSPLTKRREYEAFLRGPALAVTDRFGSVDRYRMGGQYLQALALLPAPQDAFRGEFGIQEEGQVIVELAAPENDPDGIAARLFELASTWRNVLVDLDLVTRIFREDGTSVEIVNERRCLVRSTKRRGNALVLEIVDVGRSELEATIPSKRYTVADFPKLYVDHVGRPIPQVVGLGRKIPLTYIDNTGPFRYSACEVLAAGAPTVLTLYRDGRIVSATEYSVDTVVVAGTTHLRINFVQDQGSFQQGSLHELEVDLQGPGSRAVSDEIRRDLLQLGAAVDDAIFDSLAPYCVANGMLVDCPYVRPRSGIAVLQDLLLVARGQLFKTPAGAYGLFIDRPRDVHVVLDDQTDELTVDEHVWPEIKKTLKLEYRPSTSQREEFMATPLVRVTNGASGEEIYKSPYINDHEVADRLLCYLQKRENAKSLARSSIHGVQLAAGELVAIRSNVVLNSLKVFAAPQVSRPADSNEVSLLAYDESIYVYTPGALPADATNGYSPDYSQTPPAAPAAPTVVSQGTSSDTDGKTTSYALIRAVPPALNWAQLWVLVIDTTTNEQRRVQLALNGANYEATVPGLRPNRAHTVNAYAVNSDLVEGFFSPATNFTSANATTALAAPTVTVTQVQSKEVKIDLGAVANVAGQPGFYRNVLFEKVGAGAFVEVKRDAARTFIRTVAHGTLYTYKARSEDMNHNESVDSAEASKTPAAMVDDGYIPSQGVSGPSIADGSINRGRSNTSAGQITGSIASGFTTGFTLQTFTFLPAFGSDGGGGTHFLWLQGMTAQPNDTGAFALHNSTGFAQNFNIRYRYVVP